MVQTAHLFHPHESTTTQRASSQGAAGKVRKEEEQEAWRSSYSEATVAEPDRLTSLKLKEEPYVTLIISFITFEAKIVN